MSEYDEWAWAYDAIYAARGLDRGAEARAVLGLAREHGVSVGSVLDVACGTGAHLAAFRDEVDDVVGVDLAEAVLAVARDRLPEDVRLEQGDMRSLDLDRTFDLVTCLFSSVAHLDDADELDASVAAMARHVEPGGLLVVHAWITPEDVRTEGIRDVTVAEVHGLPVTRVTSSSWDGEAINLEMAYSAATPDGVRVGTTSMRLPVHARRRYAEAFTAAGLTEVEWIDGRDAMGRGLVVGRSPSDRAALTP